MSASPHQSTAAASVASPETQPSIQQANDAFHSMPVINTWMTFLLAVSCGLIVANLYYAQPLVGPISQALGLDPKASGLIVTLTQIGYGVGLLLIVPLGDLIENRRLILGTMVLGTVALVGAATASTPLLFLIAAFCIGVGSVAVQILVPLAAHMAPEAIRGRVVGNVMSGLMMGIMLARPVAGFITQISSWHVVFYVSTVIMVLLAVVLARALPTRVPVAKLRYVELLQSMWHLTLHTPALRRRAIYHACLFAAFSMFWTTTPLLLAGPSFHLSQASIALFALAGVAGAVASPIAGRLADKGWTRPATCVAMLCVAGAFLMTHIAPAGSSWALGLLVVAAIVLDFGVSGNLTLGQRTIFALGAEHRSRLNGVYMATFFMGGAAGSALGAWAYAYGGWWLASCFGFSLPVIALIYFATE